MGRWQRGKRKKSPVAGWPRMPQDLRDKPQYREKLLWMVHGALRKTPKCPELNPGQVSQAAPRAGL